MSITLAKGMLITIIGEAVLQDRLIQLFKHHSVSGYTIIPVQGMGSHGNRMGDMAGYNTNIEIKTIVAPDVSTHLLEALKALQATHALIVFRQPVDGLFD